MPRSPLPQATFAALCALAGCSSADPAGNNVPAAYAISPAAVWAGGTVVVRSGSFHGLTTLPTLTVDTFTLALSRVDDSTLTTALPTTIPAGTFHPSVKVGTASTTLDPLTVYGYLNSQTYALNDLDISWGAYVRTLNGHPVVLGNDEVSGLGGHPVYRLVDLVTGIVTTFPHVANLTYSPGPTYQPNIFLDQISSGYATIRDLSNNLNGTDSVAVSSSGRSFGRLAASTWIAGGKQTVGVDNAPAGIHSLELAQQTEQVIISPSGDRATLRMLGAPQAGVPVYAANGNVAFRVTQMRSSFGASFSPDGSLLAMTGYVTSGAAYRTLLMNAVNGAVLGDTTTTGREPADVLIDPIRPYVYLAVANSDGHESVMVFQRSPFHLIGEMRVPESAPRCDDGECYLAALATDATNGLYLFWGFVGASGRPNHIQRFQIPTP